MKKKGITWSVLAGLLIGVAYLVFSFRIGYTFIEPILKPSDSNQLEESMDLLQETINNLEADQNTEIQFYLVDKNLFLMAFNKEDNFPECYLVPCIALCSDFLCEDRLFVREIRKDIVFETTGKILNMKEIGVNRLFLTIENNLNNISIKVS